MNSKCIKFLKLVMNRKKSERQIWMSPHPDLMLFLQFIYKLKNKTKEDFQNLT